MNSTNPTFVRRLGVPGRTLNRCISLQNCPDIFELTDGNFAVIGTDITAESAANLPEGSGCGSGERIVAIPRELLVRAKPDIPTV